MFLVNHKFILDEDGQLTLDNPITTDRNSRVEVIVLIREEVEVDESDTPLEVIKEDFRQAWGEAMSGQTIPAAEIWDGIEDV